MSLSLWVWVLELSVSELGVSVSAAGPHLTGLGFRVVDSLERIRRSAKSVASPDC